MTNICAKCQKDLDIHFIMVGALGNFCSSECLEAYRTHTQKETEKKAYQNFCQLLYAMNRVMLSDTPSEKDVQFIKDVEANVLNTKNWIKQLAEVEE